MSWRVVSWSLRGPSRRHRRVHGPYLTARLFPGTHSLPGTRGICLMRLELEGGSASSVQPVSSAGIVSLLAGPLGYKGFAGSAQGYGASPARSALGCCRWESRGAVGVVQSSDQHRDWCGPGSRRANACAGLTAACAREKLFTDLSEGSNMMDPEAQQAPKLPWTSPILDLLSDWEKRATANAEIHYAIARRLADRNVMLGMPVVLSTTFIGTSVFATLQESANNVTLRVTVGVVSVLAAVLASMQTFLRFSERSEKHRAAAEKWAAIRREIATVRALHPDYIELPADPKKYLDDLRGRMNEVSAQSPELGDRNWARAQLKYGIQQPPTKEAVRTA